MVRVGRPAIRYGNMWAVKADAYCVTTNGTITKNGKNVMGGGVAREASEKHPWLPRVYASMIGEYGHNVFLLPRRLIMFPTKYEVTSSAHVGLIINSCCALMRLIDLYDFQAVSLPAPGVGLGGLDWEDVRPRIEPYLDGRVTIWRYEKEAPVE